MTARRLYRLPIPSDAQLETEGTIQRQVTSIAALGGDTSGAESTGLEADQQLLRGQYRGTYADIMADDVEELFDAPDIEVVPYFATDGALATDGYYVLENVTASPVKPQASGNLHQFDGILRRKGSRSDSWRAVTTEPATVTSDFGSDNSSTDVGVPASASAVRWYNPVTGERTDPGAPTATATRPGEFGDVDIYDIDSAPYSSPALIFDLSYADEGDVDVVAWDDRGQANKTDGNGVVQWANVYRQSHSYVGERVISNRLLRLTLDETAGISAEQWDDGAGSWSTVSLGASDWQLLDADLTRIAPAGVEAQLVFEDTAGSSTYALDMMILRGWDEAVFARTQSATSATPAGLQTLLSPIASDNVQIPGATTTIIPRKEARE